MAKNQCDGCARGLPLKDGIHRNDRANGYDLIGCTAHLYQEKAHWLSGEEINNLGVPLYKPSEPSIQSGDLHKVGYSG